MNRNLIGSLAAIAPADIKICGFVASIRNTKRFIFLVVRDFSGSVQVFVSKEENPELADICSTLTVNSTVEVLGEVNLNSHVKLGGIEIYPQKIIVVSLAPSELPIDENSSQELKMNWRFLELRAPENRLIFELSTVIEQAMRQYWSNHGFIEIHSPKLMGTCSESGSELFSVPYFGKTAYLAQSPQFYKQMAMNAGFERVFEIGPVFRANPSFTSRHETEFISVDTEISWINSHEDVMMMEEEWIQYFMTVAAKKLGCQVQKLYGKEIIIPTTPFPRIPLATVKEILKKEFGCVSQKENDLSPEEEQLLGQYVEQHYGHDFVFVTDYPVSVRPFYHMRHESNPTITKSFDLIYRGVEVTTGAQREHRYDVLVSQILEKEKSEKDSKLMESLKDYLTFFQYGSVPHGGFGFGLARLIMKMLGLPNIRAVTLVSRNPKRLTP